MSDALRAELTLRLQRQGMLPHYAARQAAAVISSVPPEDAAHAGMDMLLQDAMSSSLPSMFGTLQKQKSALEHTRALSRTRARAMKMTVTINKTDDHVHVNADELVWSPERSGKNFSLPATVHLKPPNVGLFDQLIKTAARETEVDAAISKLKAEEKDAEYRSTLAKQAAEHKRAVIVTQAEREAEKAATMAEVERLRALSWAEFRARKEWASDTQASVREYNREQKARADEARKVEEFQDGKIKAAADAKAAEDAARLAAKQATLRAELKQAKKDNDRDMARKQLEALKEKQENRRMALETQAKLDAEDAARAAWKAKRDADIAAKINAIGEQLVDPVKVAQAAAARAEREAHAIQAAKAAEAAAKEAARKAEMVACARQQQQQLAEKARNHLLEKAESARLGATFKQQAAEEQAEAEAKHARALAEGERLREMLEKQMYDRARAMVTPAGNELEKALNKHWLTATRAKIEQAEALGIVASPIKLQQKAGGSSSGSPGRRSPSKSPRKGGAR